MAKLKYLIFDIFKIFFPSWAFFDESETNITLKYRIADSLQNININTWESISIDIKRSVFKLIYNPEVNIQLAINSNLELLIDSINNNNRNIENIDDNIYYKITKNYVKHYIFNNHTPYVELNEIKVFQFKISIKKEYDLVNDDDIFISEIFKLDKING